VDAVLDDVTGAALEIGDGVGERRLGLVEPQPDFLTESDVTLFGGGFELAPESFVNPQIHLNDCVRQTWLTTAHVTLLAAKGRNSTGRDDVQLCVLLL
jgi:hypothetical protein